MISGECLALLRQLSPDLLRTEQALLNFIDRAQKRIVKKMEWPDCWLTTLTVQNQQEYQSPPIIRLHAAYVAGQLATQTDRATLEGRQIGLYDQDPAPQTAFLPAVAASGTFQVSGALTNLDVLTATIGGVPIVYTVGVADSYANVAAQFVALVANNPFANSLVSAVASATVPGLFTVTAMAAGVGGNAITIAASKSLGATETWAASGVTLAGGISGSGGAPGTVGAFAPHWVMQSPVTYPDPSGAWGFHRPRPAAQPWCFGQPPRYYWRGGSIGVVPSPSNAVGVTIALDCVANPATIVTGNEQMIVPDMWMDEIVWDAIAMARFADADPRSATMAQAADAKRKEAEREIVSWKNGFEGDEPKTPRVQTQRVRTGGSRIRKRCR